MRSITAFGQGPGPTIASVTPPMARLAVDPGEKLPLPARTKLAGFRAAHEDAVTLLRALSDRRQEANLARMRWQRRIEQIRREAPKLDRDEAPYRQADEGLRAAEEELVALGEREAALRARLPDFLPGLEQWLQRLSVEIKEHNEPVRLDLRKGESVADGVDRIRAKLRELRADLHGVRSAPVPSSVARERMRQQVRALAQAGGPDPSALIEGGHAIKWPSRQANGQIFAVAGGETGAAVTGFAAVDVPDLPAVVCWLFEREVVARLDEEIAAISDDENALSDEERASRERGILDKILATEREEERVIVEGEAAGQTIPRRVDADPRAVLGLASDLPGYRSA